MSTIANEKSPVIKFKLLENILNLNTINNESSTASEDLKINYTGDEIEIGFNSKFMIEMLNNIGSENISLEMSAPNRAGILLPLDGQEDGEETLMLVMPVMLNS